MTEIILADGTSWEKIYFLETPTFHDKTFWVTSMLRRYKAMRSELDEQDQISLDQWLDKYNVFPGILITIQCGGNFEYFWDVFRIVCCISFMLYLAAFGYLLNKLIWLRVHRAHTETCFCKFRGFVFLRYVDDFLIISMMFFCFL